MRLCNLIVKGAIRLGAMVDGECFDLAATAVNMGLDPEYRSIDDMLLDWRRASDHVYELIERAGQTGDLVHTAGEPAFAAPVRHPKTFRDFYAFEEHVRNARRLRGLDVAEEWFQFPVFYFSNPNTIKAPGAAVKFPSVSDKRDYELEVGAILGGDGSDLDVESAETLIAGYTVMNDWSARDVQRAEMAVSLGPAKGKDFATSIGPWLVTPDEIADRRKGKGYDLRMTAKINGELMSDGNWSTIHYSFGEMIARASRDAAVYAGELFGSGTVGMGCLLERGLAHDLWLKSGDRVELEIERLGTLINRIV